MSSDDAKLILICRKLQRGVALTPDEEQCWKHYCDEHPIDLEYLLTWTPPIEEDDLEEEPVLAFEAFCEKYTIPLATPCPAEKSATPVGTTGSHRFLWWQWVAASLFVVWLPVYLLLHKEDRQHPVAATTKEELLPGSFKAILYFSEKDSLKLNDASGLYKAGLEDSASGQESGSPATNRSAPPAAGEQDGGAKPFSNWTANCELGKPCRPNHQEPMRIIKTPPGGIYKILLADSTLVQLNAGSALEYPARFEAGARMVKLLKGEACFEVKHKKDNQPFYVVTSNGTIQVLGTIFNVNTYEPGKMLTTLLKGSVNIIGQRQEKRLQPGDQATVDSKGITITRATDEEAIDWTKGQFTFRNVRLEFLLLELARWYDIKQIEYKDPVQDERFTFLRGDRSNALKDLLEDISVAGPVRFELNGPKLMIYKR